MRCSGYDSMIFANGKGDRERMQMKLDVSEERDETRCWNDNASAQEVSA